MAVAAGPSTSPNPWERPAWKADPVPIREDMPQIKITLWNCAGIVRSPRHLSRARRILLELREEIQTFHRGCGFVRELIELRNAAQTARPIEAPFPGSRVQEAILGH